MWGVSGEQVDIRNLSIHNDDSLKAKWGLTKLQGNVGENIQSKRWAIKRMTFPWVVSNLQNWISFPVVLLWTMSVCVCVDNNEGHTIPARSAGIEKLVSDKRNYRGDRISGSHLTHASLPWQVPCCRPVIKCFSNWSWAFETHVSPMRHGRSVVFTRRQIINEQS